MNRKTKIATAAGLAVLLAGVGIAGASYADGYGWGHHGGQSAGGHHGMGSDGNWGRHGSRHGRQMLQMFESYDSNGDGKLTQAEIDETRGARLARFDTDGNGSLNLTEYQALWLDAMRERMVDRFQDLDDDGDGAVTKEEFARPFARMVRYMDMNDDGALGRDDMDRHRHGRDRDDN
jgi:hypothetical protein